MPYPTLMDIAVANAADPAVALIEESIRAHPELTLGAARTISGINFHTLVRTAIPTVSFRKANAGSAAVKGTYENRLVECYIMNPQWIADKAVADAFNDGAPAYIAMEGLGMTEGSMRTICSQFYYGTGTGGDALGFPGLLAAYDSTNMVVDAGGTTDNIASSVWGVRFGPLDTQWIWGKNGQLDLSEAREQTVFDGSGNPYDAYIQSLLARPGLQISRVQSTGRIKKLTTDSGKGLTDALLSQLLEKFPVGYKPDVWLMSRRSQGQLQRSRTTFSPTGDYAPIPTEAHGIPIAVTDSILDTETLAL